VLTGFKIRVVFEHGRGKTGIRWNDFTQRASSQEQSQIGCLEAKRGEERSKELFAKHFARKR